MALKNNLYIICLFVFFSNTGSAKIILPELLAKQAVANIRFLSQDGKFTYYQKRSGSLLYSSNYKVIEMIKGEIGTQYTLLGSNARKKIIIMQNQSFHNFYSLRAKEKLFIVDFGETSVREIGLGSSPRLHLDDSWMSYYDYYKKVLSFENTTNSALKFSIKLNNRINPYFSPQVVMSDDNTVYYTDLGETGDVGLIEYKRNTGKSEILFKTKTPMVKAEICLHQNSLILGIFGINFSKEGSIISKAKLPITDFSKRETIYSSAVNDSGQLVCNFSEDVITFIKNYGTTDLPHTDLVDLDPKTKELKLLSELKTVTSVLNMDGTLLTLEKGKYYIVKGNVDYKSVDSFKALPPGGANEGIKKIDSEMEL